MILFGSQFARGSLFDPITATLGAVSAGTSILGGIFGSHAAGASAATIQQNAANAANKQVTDAAAWAANPGITAAATACRYRRHANAAKRASVRER